MLMCRRCDGGYARHCDDWGMHKRREWDHQHPGEQIDNATRWKVITDASVEVGPALFISLLIITCRFIPIFYHRSGRTSVCTLAFTKRTPWRARPRWPSSSFDSDGILDRGKFLQDSNP